MDLETVVGQPVRSWGERLLNGMEEGVFKAHPVIGDLKRSYWLPARSIAAMSGSGPAYSVCSRIRRGGSSIQMKGG